MANFTAADVKKLRELTQAGMMDCKKALTEADGDFDKAVELLRVKGAAKAAARGAERETAAGLVATSGNALVELKSETDFVAKNEDFIAKAQQIADVADSVKATDTAALKAAELDGKTVGEVVEDLAITIGEKIELGRSPTSTAPPSPTCTSVPPTSRPPSACWWSSRATRLPPAPPRCRSPR